MALILSVLLLVVDKTVSFRSQDIKTLNDMCLSGFSKLFKMMSIEFYVIFDYNHVFLWYFDENSWFHFENTAEITLIQGCRPIFSLKKEKIEKRDSYF